MKRRDFLKDLAIAGSGLLWRPATANVFRLQDADASAKFGALPIRGLVEKEGKSWQPIQLPLPHPADGLEAVIRLDGTVLDRQIVPSGAQTLEVLAPAIDAIRTSNLSLEIAGAITEWNITLKPVRKVLIYVLPHSHNDIGYTDLQRNVEAKQVQNLLTGIELARKTADYPEGARFVWNLECMWAADLFMQRMSAADKDAFKDAVKRGWVALNGMYANTLTGLCRPEELVQLFRCGTELGNQFGVKVDSAMISDVPGFTWGTATAMVQAGIRYFSAAPNWFDRIGSLMQVWQDKPFWWIAPSGREKLLVWVPWTGYAMSHVVGSATKKWVGDYQDRLDEVKFPYDISYIRWSGHGDNAVPDPQVSEFFKYWNTKFSWPKFMISSTSTAFAAFEQRHGKELPEFKGDLTPYWEDGAGSSALETAMNRNSADRLVQAAALFAMRDPGAYSPAAFRDAWRNVLLYSEHTWGAWNSVSDSENKFVTDQWEVKRSFAVNADRQSRDLLAQASVASTGKKLPGGPKHESAVFIHNTTSWTRSELVLLPKEFSLASNHVIDQHDRPIPSQRLSTGELAIWVSNIPPFGSARFRIVPGASRKPTNPAGAQNNALDNGFVHVQVDAKTGGIVELRSHGSEKNLVDSSGGEQINQFLFLPGDHLSDLQSNGPVKITIEEDGPLVAVLRIESSAPGCNSLVRKTRLAAGADHVEIINIVDKRRAPMNPHPGEGGPGESWAQRGGKESVQFAFPFNIEGGQIRMGIPLATMRPEIDQLPGACKNWLPVGRWVDMSNDQTGITWTTLDAPLVEIGGITANLLGSQHNPDIWLKHIEPTQRFYSWVMNNHWGTNYRAYQEGPVEFRYALRPHSGYDPVEAYRFATGLSQPLVAAYADESRPLPISLRGVEPADVVVTSLKPSDDGKAWIIRLFGASGEDRQAKLIWSQPAPNSTWLSDTSENPGEKVGDSVLVRGWDLVTLRVEPFSNLRRL